MNDVSAFYHCFNNHVYITISLSIELREKLVNSNFIKRFPLSLHLAKAQTTFLELPVLEKVKQHVFSTNDFPWLSNQQSHFFT